MTTPEDILSKAFAMLPQPTGADFGKPDWEYRDVPWLTDGAWEKFFGILGDGKF